MLGVIAGLIFGALGGIGVDDVGGAVTIGIGQYSTPYEVDQLVRCLGSLG